MSGGLKQDEMRLWGSCSTSSPSLCSPASDTLRGGGCAGEQGVAAEDPPEAVVIT